VNRMLKGKFPRGWKHLGSGEVLEGSCFASPRNPQYYLKALATVPFSGWRGIT